MVAVFGTGGGGLNLASGPYFPPQSPPATGFNSFTDSSGQVWISYNGSPWVRASAFSCHISRAAGYTTSAAAIPFDTIDNDLFGAATIGAAAHITAPLTGNYILCAATCYQSGANQDTCVTFIRKNASGSPSIQGNVSLTTGIGAGWNVGSLASDVIRLNAGDVIDAYQAATVSRSSYGGSAANYLSATYQD